MKNVIVSFLVVFSFLCFSSFINPQQVDAYVPVKGYTKKNGTYVAPHVRSNPNGLKYDNYSYKPSQGLYNKTYGTKGVAWDTPTYITDPDYYIGKSIYESNKSLSSSNYTGYNFTNDLRVGNTSNEIMALQTRLGVSPATGYYGSLTKNAVIRFQKENNIYPTSGNIDSSTRTALNSKTAVDLVALEQSCVSTYGANSYFNGQINDKGGATCDCKAGYKFNSSQTSCVMNADTWCKVNNPGNLTVEVTKYSNGNFNCSCYSDSNIGTRVEYSCKKPEFF